MNIIQYCTALPASGGVVSQMVEIAKESRKHGHTTQVVIGSPVANNQYVADLKNHHIPVLGIPAYYVKLARAILYPVYGILSVLLLCPYMIVRRKTIKDSFNTIFRECSYYGFNKHLTNIIRRFTLSKIEKLVTVGKHSIIHVHYLGTDQCHTVLRHSKKNDIPTVLHYHANVSYSQITAFKVLFENPDEILGKRGVVIVLSEGLRQKMQAQLGHGVTIVALPNWVPGRQLSLQTTPANRQSIHLCTVTRMIGGKGVEDLIRAIETLVTMNIQVTASFVGGGIGLPYFINTADRAGIGHLVKFTGEIDESAVDVELANSDIFVLASSTEAMPLTLLKAMSFGLPVVMTPVGAVPDVVNAAENGILVGIGNVSQMVAAVLKIKDDPEYQRQLGKNSRVFYEEHFTSDHVWASLEGIYTTCLSPLC